MQLVTVSKSYVRGVRVGKVVRGTGEALGAGVREVGNAFKWLGGEVAKDSRAVAHSFAEFGRGVKAGVVA